MNTETVTAGGRSYTLRRLAPHELAKVLAGSTSESYAGVALLCHAITMIDGIPVPPIRNAAGLIRAAHQIDELDPALTAAFERLNAPPASQL